MKAPNSFRNWPLDAIDREIINALGKRFAYVKAAAKSSNKVKQVSRHQKDLIRCCSKGRIWAESAGLNPDVIEKLYRDLINYFIDEAHNS